MTHRFHNFIFFVCPLHRVKFICNDKADEFWMQKAIESAIKAGETDEVPIGACLINKQGELIAVAGNRTISDNDPTAHAEILVLREAASENRQLSFD